MEKTAFIDELTRRGMKAVGPAAVEGVVDGYPLLAVWANGRAVTIYALMPKEVWNGRKKELKAAFKGKGGAGHDGRRFFLSRNTKNMADFYNEGLRDFTNTLRGMGIYVPDTCGLCGRSGCNAVAILNNAATPIHTDCLENTLQNAEQKANNASSSGNYVTGLVGAFLGAIVGMLPTFLTIIFLDTYYAIAFALIPLGAYYGYKLLKGRMNYFAAFAAIAASIAGVIALDVAVIVYVAAKEIGMPVLDVFEIVRPIVFTSDFWDMLGGDTIASQAIFTVLGVVYVWRVITATPKSELAGVQSVRETAIPYSRGGFSGYADGYADSFTDGDMNV